MHGWLPATVQVIACVVLVAAIGRRGRRWRYVWLPGSALCGIALAAAAYWYIASEGMAGNPAPHGRWIWIGLSGVAAGVLVTGWRGARWWRRGASMEALALSVLCAALALNLWTGYFPTVQTAWNQLAAGPLPDQTHEVTVAAMQQRHVIPPKGTVVPVQISDAASGFKHRGELVYLSPAWYATNPPPPLPTVMMMMMMMMMIMIMIGGEFNTPADWVRTGNAVTIADQFAATHGGNAPVLVFADVGGAFNNDTECVNGSRGNVADHLTKDVVPFMVSHFGVSAHPENWGVVGSMGGTCAVDLVVIHPDMFTAFEDIAGDASPNTGSKTRTIDRLFGGNPAAYAAFDPATVISRHGRYTNVAGWFSINNQAAAPQSTAANQLCSLGGANGIACAVVTRPGNHDWPYASHAFAAALPWLAGQIHTPAVVPIPLPTSPASASYVQIAQQ